MDKTRISSLQFFSLMVLFQMGTALVVNVGILAGRDAWLAILVGMAAGSLLFAVYANLNKLFPDMQPTSYCKVLLGKRLGTAVGIAYVVFFLHKASRDLMDGGLLVLASALKETPLMIINLLMILTVAYALHKGVEVLARTAFIFLIVVMVIGAFIVLVVFFSDIMNLNRLRPILGGGVRDVFVSVYRQNYQFPFAEVICFVTVMPSLSNKKGGVKAGYLAILLSGLILSGAIASTIAVLGVDITERSVFPLLTMIGKASIADFIQRTDILVVMILIIGVFFKISLFYYAAVIGMSDIFKIPYRKLLYPVAVVILLFSLMISRSFSDHLTKGGEVLYRVDPVFFVVIPLILFLAGFVYKFRLKRQGRSGAQSREGDRNPN
ncbi:GerAB/ArcD/ProY family transporter [Paenibacillus sp. Marseille-P2973]|uniref:GerAB/ArcD/ProY family transporter n=1 Tax=Paenibacillus sp. Marseille-P2973 TaxID=1871032 RepID=UPI001B37B83C|nr:GerAB/ArcD/ProY family transporter [Paenibacillus sp. Marseille-P2973]MBQ4900123.1 GerAB/ArcD/ProY family transporter [Paenibacillus sp. Marseille-P2973]